LVTGVTGLALAGTFLLGACGGGTSSVAGSTTSVAAKSDAESRATASTTLAPVSTTLPASTTTATTVAPDATAPAPVAPSAKKAASLATGAATGFPFGSVKDESVLISLLPPNSSYVNSARVAAAPQLGPFKINPNAGAAGWPDACTLTSAAQLEALFPAITGLSGTPVGTKAEILGGGNTPHNSDCQFNLTTTFDAAADESGVPSWVKVSIEEIDTGAPQAYQTAQQQQAAGAAQYPAQYANYPDLANGLSCFTDGNELQCLKGDVNFWIEGQKVTGGNFETSDQADWIAQIELPLAEKLGAEITT
jgi:hypothetical protein